ncbi:MAG: UDP-N-acetylglucosamine--N-acetylmuramyl-(pentapeptide) pyrophosphoryl-undecaprenol [Pseudomonadota bacterium]|jgi:UDP-N-acetylglucosamine--N-acetylmuramyl-(pentapeptide) pyrophosphoryl-undecaprenol N-acetylglucosamine transferase
MKKKFLVAGGGTGGHIYPGVAIARAIETLDKNVEVEFVGSLMGLETKIVPREGFPLHILSAGKLNYKGSAFGKLMGLLRVFVGLVQAFVLLRRLKPVGVLGVGGYASGPLVLAAALMKIPTSIWEPNAHPGLANRWLSRIVPRSFIVFESAKKYLQSTEIVLVGLPIRKELESVASRPADSEFHVLSFGGSQGAKAINEALEKTVTTEMSWLHKGKLIHQTGVTDYSRIKESYEKSVFEVSAFEYLFEMDQYYSWADVVICRSGASTIAELCAAGKPAVLVPLPTAADDHQRKNALAMVEHQAAILLEQKDLTAQRLNEILTDLQKNPEVLTKMSQNARSLHQPQAAEVIAKLLVNAF